MAEPMPDSDETQQLLDRAGVGDPAAFEELFARHRDFLCLVVRLRMDARLRVRVDPSDVVQEAQADAFRRLRDFLDRRPMPFRLWLRKTTQERLLKVQRAHLETGRQGRRAGGAAAGAVVALVSRPGAGLRLDPEPAARPERDRATGS